MVLVYQKLAFLKIKKTKKQKKTNQIMHITYMCIFNAFYINTSFLGNRQHFTTGILAQIKYTIPTFLHAKNNAV